MCYRCGYCNVVVPHRTPMRKHIKYKRDGILGNVQIAKETPACVSCLEKIGYGEKPTTTSLRKITGFLPPKPRASEIIKSVSVAKVGVNRFKSAQTYTTPIPVPTINIPKYVHKNGNDKGSKGDKDNKPHKK